MYRERERGREHTHLFERGLQAGRGLPAGGLAGARLRGAPGWKGQSSTLGSHNFNSPRVVLGAKRSHKLFRQIYNSWLTKFP